MTTTIKVEAHCSDDTIVEVIKREPNHADIYFLNNGEIGSYYVYGEQEILVRELPKVING